MFCFEKMFGGVLFKCWNDDYNVYCRVDVVWMFWIEYDNVFSLVIFNGVF